MSQAQAKASACSRAAQTPLHMQSLAVIREGTVWWKALSSGVDTLPPCCRSESDRKALVAALSQPTDQQRRVGPATAQKLFTILTSTDPDAVVEA